MKFKTKFVIFLAAALISFVGFSLIASPVVDVLVLGKEAGYEQISNFLAKSGVVQTQKSSIG
ncbi:MAG: hypothetical protein MUP98_03825 [Candidatus Aminicenantes bacterium]|nr:hypothetical protein [Candidatus Aminicenantes bacterium]